MLRDLGITPGRNGIEMREQLKDVLIKEARAGRRFVVVMDEAQNMSDDSLEMVRLLTNFETPRAKLMQIVLSGQPKLSNKLMSPLLEQLRQRISTFCQLEPLSAEQTAAYINHRLMRAGYAGSQLFTEDALKLLAGASRGIPRTINNLCFNALTLTCALRRKQVDVDIAAEVIADLRLTPEIREVRGSLQKSSQSRRSNLSCPNVPAVLEAMDYRSRRATGDFHAERSGAPQSRSIVVSSEIRGLEAVCQGSPLNSRRSSRNGES